MLFLKFFRFFLKISLFRLVFSGFKPFFDLFRRKGVLLFLKKASFAAE